MPPNAPPTIKPSINTASAMHTSSVKFGDPKPNDTPRIILNAQPFWGKTTFGAHAPNAAIVQVKGENGYETLFAQSRVPKIPCVNVNTWQDLTAVTNVANLKEIGCKTLVIDSFGGAERCVNEMVCNRDFDGAWGERGYGMYGAGAKTSAREWAKFLDSLSTLNAQGISIVLLSHVKIVNYKNPAGPDYDRYMIDAEKELREITLRWANIVLFGQFKQVIDTAIDKKQQLKGKGLGSGTRVVHTTYADAWDAKNQHGMPPTIELDDDPSKVYETIMQHTTGASK